MYYQDKKEASYKKQTEASDKIKIYTNNLYNTKTYNISRAH